MGRSQRVALATVTFILAASFAATALAAPVKWQSVDVTLHPEDSGAVMLIAGTLPDGASLPAVIGLPAPAGSPFLWMGEVLGGATSADPDVQYSVTSKGGYDLYVATLSKSRTAQLEVQTTPTVSADGVHYDASLSWVAADAVPSVRMTAVLPVSVQITREASGALLQADATNSYYYKTVENVKAGQKLDLNFTYSVVATGTGTAAPAGSSQTTLLIFLGVLVLVVLGIVAVIVVRARA